MHPPLGKLHPPLALLLLAALTAQGIRLPQTPGKAEPGVAALAAKLQLALLQAEEIEPPGEPAELQLEEPWGDEEDEETELTAEDTALMAEVMDLARSDTEAESMQPPEDSTPPEDAEDAEDAGAGVIPEWSEADELEEPEPAQEAEPSHDVPDHVIVHLPSLPWETLLQEVPALSAVAYRGKSFLGSISHSFTVDAEPEFQNITRLEMLVAHCKRACRGTDDASNATARIPLSAEETRRCQYNCGSQKNYWRELKSAAMRATHAEAEAGIEICKQQETGRPCKSYSQLDEDMVLYNMFFKGKRRGTYMELRALDGARFSNTKFLEESLGWSGILIEPSARFFEWLKMRRSDLVKTGRDQHPAQNWFFNEGICEGVGKDEEPSKMQFEDCGMPADFEREDAYPDCHNKTVKCEPLHKIIERTDRRTVDFLSLRAAGHTVEAMKTFDWKRIRVRVVLVERGDADAPMEEMLLGAGMTYVRELRMSHVFANRNWIEGPDEW